MAIKLGNYNASKSLLDTQISIEHNAKVELINALIVEVNPFIKDMEDIRDTTLYLEKNDEEFGRFLHDYLHSYAYDDYKKQENGHYIHEKTHLEMNSYWGVCACYADYYHKARITPNGITLYYQWNKHEPIKDEKNWSGQLFVPYFRKYAEQMTNEVLDMYITSFKQLIKYFPPFRDKFFEMVSNREFVKF